MRTTYGPELDLMATRKIFDTAVVTVSGLYLATHSVLVTLIGTVAASLVTSWTMWLSHRRNPLRGGGPAAASQDHHIVRGAAAPDGALRPHSGRTLP